MDYAHKERIGRLSHLLTRAGYRMATAESCTGGMIGSICTSFAGSSEWFAGGIIAYANDVKGSVLGVPAAVLEEHGAVSGEVVQHMAAGALCVCRVQAAVAVSGVAGPGGGTPDKPVGTVWMAAAVEERAGVCRIDLEALRQKHPDTLRVTLDGRSIVVAAMLRHFEGDRSAVREQAAWQALLELTELLETRED
ncbi:MAG: CinA family protein [Deltaproteobacteria bacterium]|nr:CinA family protein [Deltaproteobacteria bacterium]